jgi:DNA-binding MarR family transcriptional regulator
VQASAASTQTSPSVLAAELHRFWQLIMRGSGPAMVRVLEEIDLSITHMKVLHVLGDADEDLSVKELAVHIGMSLPGASRTADGLLKRGFVERHEDPEDRRIKRLTMTAAGRDALGRLEAARLAGIERYIQTLSPEQRDALHAALRSLT